MGNWDAWVLEGFPPTEADPWKRFIEQGEWWARQLSARDREFVSTFRPRLELQANGLRILCFHGTPRSYDEMILATTPHEELLQILAGFEQPLMVAGHTHVQLARVVEGTLVVNPGSVGLPFRGIPLGGAAADLAVGRVRARASRGSANLSGAPPHELRRRRDAPAHDRKRRPPRRMVGWDVGAPRQKAARSATPSGLGELRLRNPRGPPSAGPPFRNDPRGPVGATLGGLNSAGGEVSFLRQGAAGGVSVLSVLRGGAD
jgi:predicted phosphodiesterase